MNGDLIVHRAPKLDDREGPLRILAAADINQDHDLAASQSKIEGDLLAIALLHFLPPATLEQLVHTLIDAQFQTRYVHGPQR